MTTDDAKATVFAQVLATWALTPYAANKIGLDDKPFTPTSGQAHLVATIKHARTVQSTMGRGGQRKFDYYAMLLVDIAIPGGRGTKSLSELLDRFRRALTGKLLSGPSPTDQVTMMVAQIGSEVDDGTWARAQITAPFWYTDTF